MPTAGDSSARNEEGIGGKKKKLKEGKLTQAEVDQLGIDELMNYIENKKGKGKGAKGTSSGEILNGIGGGIENGAKGEKEEEDKEDP
mmetsp:Transcript_13710/g.13427  ORF Transcript_13710/g.13427 Transcript_13710/m.13427 type:complete len:87 (-) Transcript_13710:479-739(-)|eukprot:CAMPEP_0170543942 /NCGR_PEP_ID=MMETSP0211-20121228/2885_1 /TAXON_ID=311385 /ORGANISM="Pseudokeronopsis sp., Strain OXSARD2" /LENGTH=86 /DNA_ID=CAMNT_0010847463 /DNA_START=1868 /DNA_END=2128 /DNA_ORIENTATION=-